MNRKIRALRVEGNLAFVPLNHGFEAIIDAEDAPLVSGFTWRSKIARRADGSIRAVYAVTSVPLDEGGQAERRMHRVLMSAADDEQIDHANGDGLDNRRSTNLRLATHAQNMQNRRQGVNNTSGVKGVSWQADRHVWRARIKANGAVVQIGMYERLEAAAAAVDFARDFLHGDFARSA